MDGKKSGSKLLTRDGFIAAAIMFAAGLAIWYLAIFVTVRAIRAGLGW